MATDKPKPEWLSSAQVREMLGVGPNWLSQARNGLRKGPTYYSFNKKIRYRKDDVLAFIEACRRES